MIIICTLIDFRFSISQKSVSTVTWLHFSPLILPNEYSWRNQVCCCHRNGSIHAGWCAIASCLLSPRTMQLSRLETGQIWKYGWSPSAGTNFKTTTCLMYVFLLSFFLAVLLQLWTASTFGFTVDALLFLWQCYCRHSLSLLQLSHFPLRR